MVIVLPMGWALASSMAARSVHGPAAVAHTPAPGGASGAWVGLLTAKVRLPASAGPGGAEWAAMARRAPRSTSSRRGARLTGIGTLLHYAPGPPNRRPPRQ